MLNKLVCDCFYAAWKNSPSYKELLEHKIRRLPKKRKHIRNNQHIINEGHASLAATEMEETNNSSAPVEERYIEGPLMAENSMLTQAISHEVISGSTFPSMSEI